MDGVLNVYKPKGPTSHDIVAEVRRLLGQKRAGHAGTLDPIATGVLIICLGKATRVVEYLMGAPKEYKARLVLGISTDSQDSTGKELSRRSASFVTSEILQETVKTFEGNILQVPPMVSAVKHEGKRLYALARNGINVERKPREVTIYSIDIDNFIPGEIAQGEIRVRCSSGTYIRTLCSDIGEKLGCGGHMSELERTSVGQFCVDKSVSMDDLKNLAASGSVEHCLYSIDDVLKELPYVIMNENNAKKAMHGMPIEVDEVFGQGETVRMLGPDMSIVAIGQLKNTEKGIVAKPRKVLVEVG